MAAETSTAYDDAPDMVVQRFEYYHNYGRNDIWDPYDFGSMLYRDSYVRWPYTRHINWNRHSVAWNYACWMSVYDRTWQGCSPVFITPHVVYRSPVIYQEIVQVPKQEIVIPRTNPRRGDGFSGGSAPPPNIKTRPVEQATPSPSNSGSSTSSKQATDEKKEKDKEEKREEKRTERKKRGGMR